MSLFQLSTLIAGADEGFVLAPGFVGTGPDGSTFQVSAILERVAVVHAHGQPDARWVVNLKDVRVPREAIHYIKAPAARARMGISRGRGGHATGKAKGGVVVA